MRLVIHRDNTVIRSFEIKPEDNVLTIGRSQALDIYLPDESLKVSRIHAVIVRLEEKEPAHGAKNKRTIRFFLRDLGSAQGTRINGNYVYKKLLVHEDEIRIGDYRLRFLDDDAVSDTVEGLPLEYLFKQLHVKDSASLDGSATVWRVKLSEVFTERQKEFVASLIRSGVGENLSEKPYYFMTALMELMSADKAVAGLFEDGKSHVTFKRGLERDNLYCSEEFLNTLWTRGAYHEDGALWAPLPDNGFLGLLRTSPPPFTDEDVGFVRAVLARVAALNRREQATRFDGKTIWPVSMVGLFKEKQEIISVADKNDLDYLILGETGVGKEVVARYIHNNSKRRLGPFVSVNCAALPRELASSELFGHEKGAFTGAVEAKKGYFEQANGGTLFLDEIGDLPDSLQAHLLSAFQQREISRLGGRQPIPVDIRILAATDRDVVAKLEDDSFRRALFERFNHSLNIPPLRERPLEIPLLAYYFVDTYSPITRIISREAMQLLRDYDWPGNVRELQKVIQNVVTRSGDVVFSWDLPSKIRYHAKLAEYDQKIQQTLKETERDQIIAALKETRGDRKAAAGIIGIARSTFYVKLKEYNIPDDF